MRAKIEVREHLYCVSLRRRVHTIVRHFKNREVAFGVLWKVTDLLTTPSDLVATPSQKAVGTKTLGTRLLSRGSRGGSAIRFSALCLK